MSYLNAKGHTVLVPGDIILLNEPHTNSCATLKKGEKCVVTGSSDNGSNYYGIQSMETGFFVGGAILGGLSDNSIQIVHDVGEGKKHHEVKAKDIPDTPNNSNIAATILLHMFRVSENNY